MTVIEIGRKQLWPLSAILAGGGLAMVLIDVFVTRGLSLFSMLAVLCWMVAVIPLVEHRTPTPVVRADENGIRFWAAPATGGDLDDDPRVVTWLPLPGALDLLGEQLRVFRPDLQLMDLRAPARS